MSAGRFVWPVILGWAALAQPQFDTGIALLAAERTATPKIYAVIAGRTGLFRSTNGGALWTPMYLSDPSQAQPPVGAIAMDPSNASIVYAGTALDRGGVYKSTDAGATWTRVNSGLPSSADEVVQLMALASDPLIVYALAGRTLYKTIDGARTWAQHGALPISQALTYLNRKTFAIHPVSPSIMFLGKGNVVHRSVDEGVTWSQVSRVDLADSNCCGITVVKPHPQQTGRVYAGSYGCCTPTGVYISLDNGQSWDTKLRVGVGDILVDPDNPTVIYASHYFLPSVNKSIDGGLTWGAAIDVVSTPTGSVTLAFGAPGVLYAGLGGLNQSKDGAATWQPVRGTVRPTLAATPAVLAPVAEAGSAGGTATVRVHALEEARWAVPFEASVTAGNWLTVSPAGGTAPGNITLTYSARGLTPGVYNGAVRVRSAQTFNAEIEVPVRLTVVEASATRYTITTLAGRGPYGVGGYNGPATSALLAGPRALAPDGAGGILIADSGNSCIHKVSSGGTINTVAGICQSSGFDGDGGQAAAAKIQWPDGVAADRAGSIYISDTWNARIRKVSTAGTISTFAGGGTTQFFRWPAGMALDSSDNVYVADYSNDRVLRISPAGAVATVAGAATSGFSGDGGQAIGARLNAPRDVALDASGNFYIADTANNRIRKVTAAGIITTVAGNGQAAFSGDGGQATAASLNAPRGVAVDRAGNIYIADTDNHRLRMVDTSGRISTLAGTGTGAFGGDGGPARDAQLRSPSDVIADEAGNLIIADTGNNRIRKLTLEQAGPRPQVTQDGVLNAASFQGGAVAPGMIVTAFGSGFGQAALTMAQVGADGRLATSLAGTRVLFDGVAAPLVYVSASQLSAIVPYAVAGKTAAQMEIEFEGRKSAAVALPVTEAMPGFFTADSSGKGQAAAFNQDMTPNSAANPAEPGSVVVFFATGEGETDPAGVDGKIATDVFPKPLGEVTLFIGNIPAEILYAGAAPGQVAGLLQVNARIPENVEPGDAVTVRLMIGNAWSQPGVTIAVR